MSDAEDQAAAWSAVAGAWDEHASFVDHGKERATARLVDGLQVEPGDRLLELGAGPGSLVGTWADLVGPTGLVVLSDVADGMVAIAARRAARHPQAEAVRHDAAAIDRPDGSFDVVVSRMGLMFVPEPERAFAEISRVLRRGGRFGALTWAGIEHNPWMTCVGMAGMANGVLTGGPPIGPGGPFSLGDRTALEALAKEAGFEDVETDEVDVAFEAPDMATHVRRESSLAGPMAAAFAAATEEQMDAVRRTAAELAAPYATDDGFVIPGRANLITAHV